MSGKNDPREPQSLSARMVAACTGPVCRGTLLGRTAALIWGSYLALARAGVVTGLQGADIAFIRFGVAGLLMSMWFFMHDPLRAAGIGWPRAFVLTALAGPLFVLVSVGGFQFAPLAHGALFQPSGLVIGGVIFASLILGEMISRSQIAGLVIIVCGLVLVAGPGVFSFGPTTPIGDAMFIGVGLIWALFTVLQRRWGFSPLQTTAVVSVLAASIYVPLYLTTEGLERLRALPPAMLAAQVLVQGALSGVVAVLAFTRAVQILGAGKASIFPALVPAVAILIGIPVVGEYPAGFQWLGLGLVLAGQLVAFGFVQRLWSAHIRKPAVTTCHFP